MTMTAAQARAATGLELLLPEVTTTLGPEHTVPALMTALAASINVVQMREISRQLDRKADELERSWRATSGSVQP